MQRDELSSQIIILLNSGTDIVFWREVLYVLRYVSVINQHNLTDNDMNVPRLCLILVMFFQCKATT